MVINGLIRQETIDGYWGYYFYADLMKQKF